MSNLLKFLIATVLLANVAIAVPPPPAGGLPSPQGLARLFFTARVTAKDPYISMSCFTDYIAHSHIIGEAYSANYNGCLINSTESRKQIDQEVIDERKVIEVTAVDTCQRMTNCNTIESTLEMLHCHASVGSNNTRDTYTISGNASEFATLLEERYRIIDLRLEQCIHAAERVYVEKTATNYNYLQSCLDGTVPPRPIPEAGTTTTAPATTTTTADPTTTTTLAPTTSTTTEVSTTTTATTTGNPESAQGFQQQFSQLLNLLK